jgi:hypothetical protein
MNMTVEQAKQKYCCNTVNNGQHCCGDKCMAWRWYSTVEEYIYEEQSGRSIAPPKIKRTIYKPKDEWTGFCGLAGK